MNQWKLHNGVLPLTLVLFLLLSSSIAQNIDVNAQYTPITNGYVSKTYGIESHNQANINDHVWNIVLSDDFDDGIIDNNKWIVSGDGIIEANSALNIFRDAVEDAIRPVYSFNGYFMVELRIMLEQINWQDMFHGISMLDSEGVGISFGFSQYDKFYGAIIRSDGIVIDYYSSFQTHRWYQWKLEKVKERIDIYIDGDQQTSLDMSNTKGEIIISFPGMYADGNGSTEGEPGTKSCIDYVTMFVAEGIMRWDRTYGGTDHDEAHTVIQTTDGGFALAGFTTDDQWPGYEEARLVKTDPRGVVEWSRTYRGAGRARAFSVIETKDRGFVLAGFTRSHHKAEADGWLAKTDFNGVLQWSRTYGGIGWDEVKVVIKTIDGGFALVGRTCSYEASGIWDYWLVKTDIDGNRQWERNYGGAAIDQAYSVIQMADEGYILAGHRQPYEDNKMDTWLVKTDDIGMMEWTKTFSDAQYSVAYSIVETADEGFIFAGSKIGNAWLVKINAKGEVEWKQIYGDEYHEEAYSVIQTTDGGFAFAAYKFRDADAWLVKTNTSGKVEWMQTYGDSGDEIAYSIIQTTDGDFVLAGATSSYGEGGYDFWLVKIPSYTMSTSLTVTTTLPVPTPTTILPPLTTPQTLSPHIPTTTRIPTLIQVILGLGLAVGFGVTLWIWYNRRIRPSKLSAAIKLLSVPTKKLGKKIPCPTCGAALDPHIASCLACGEEFPSCVICRRHILENLTKTPCCGAYAHTPHLQEWLRIRGKCPMCREKIQDWMLP